MFLMFFKLLSYQNTKGVTCLFARHLLFRWLTEADLEVSGVVGVGFSAFSQEALAPFCTTPPLA